jgi:hypothetical protein
MAYSFAFLFVLELIKKSRTMANPRGIGADPLIVILIIEKSQ